MAFVHNTTLTPTKLELLAGWLPRQPWYRGGPVPALTKVGGFRLDDPDGAVGIEFMAVTDASDGEPVTYHVPFGYRGAPLDGGDAALIGTAEHGVLGRRWIYDGTGDPVVLGQLARLLRGEAEPQAQSTSDTPDPTVTRFLDGDPDDLTIGIERVLVAGDPPADAAGYVSAPWRLADGGTARGVFAAAYRP
jgi:hypothetical protein